MKSSISSFILVSLIVIVVELCFWAILPPRYLTNESADYYRLYEPQARALLQGDGFTTQGKSFGYTPPGFPMILAGLFKISSAVHIHEEITIALFSLLCMCLSVIILFQMCLWLWQRKAAFAAVIILMSYPPFLWLFKQLNTEVPFLPLYYGSFLLVLSCIFKGRQNGWICFLSGVLIGLAMLIRPIAIGGGVLNAVLIFGWSRKVILKRRVYLSAMVLLGNLLIVSPWQMWLFSQTGKVVPLGTIGLSAVERFTNTSQPEVKKSVESDSLMNSKGIRDTTRVGQSLSFHNLLIKSARIWYFTRSGRFMTELMIIQCFYLVLLIGSTIVAWLKSPQSRSYIYGILLYIFYFWGVILVGGNALARYMVPPIVLFFVLIPSPLIYFRTRKKQV